jgi:hypothetical protein
MCTVCAAHWASGEHAKRLHSVAARVLQLPVALQAQSLFWRAKPFQLPSGQNVVYATILSATGVTAAAFSPLTLAFVLLPVPSSHAGSTSTRRS